MRSSRTFYVLGFFLVGLCFVVPYVVLSDDLNGSQIIRGGLTLAGVISPTALSGTANDYSPTGLSTAALVRIDGGGADRNITGLATGAEGIVKTLCNVGATNALNLLNQSASSSAANRFLLGADVTLPIDTCETLRYDGTTQRWRPIHRPLNNMSIIPGTFGPGRIVVDLQGRITSATTLSEQAYRVCHLSVGADNGAVLVDADLGPQLKGCKVPYTATVVEIAIAADAGTPSVLVRRRRCTTFAAGVCTVESTANLLSSALAAGASNFDRCANTTGTTGLDGGTTCSSTLQNTGLLPGDWLELVSGTAGGTAKRLSISVTYAVAFL